MNETVFETQWTKLVPSHVMGQQCWGSMSKTYAKLDYGLTMLKFNKKNLCQAGLWVNNVEAEWVKPVPSQVMG